MAIDPAEVLETMNWLDRFYQSQEGLGRPEGLSRNGKPDFEALAAWIFDVFLNSRLTGLDLATSKRNITHAIQQTPEWQLKHTGAATVLPIAEPFSLQISREVVANRRKCAQSHVALAPRTQLQD